VYFNVNFNVFFKLIKVLLLMSALYRYQNARCKDKRKLLFSSLWYWKCASLYCHMRNNSAWVSVYRNTHTVNISALHSQLKDISQSHNTLHVIKIYLCPEILPIPSTKRGWV